MKKSFRFALLTTTIILLVSACAPGGSSISLGTGEEILLVGFTTSMTGKYAREGTDQANGLNLWISHVNEAGGIQLPDGRAAFIEARFYDDQSDKERVPQLYIDLIEQDRVQFLFSPYGSSLTTAAAAVAQEHGVLMVTAGAAAEATHQPGYTVIYQTYTPASRYLTGAFDLYAAQPPQDRRVALVYENDTFAILAIDAIRQAAIELGLAIVVDEMYEAGQTDFSALMDTLAARHPAAIFGGGHSVDSTALARAIHEHGVPFEYIALLVGPAEPSFGDIGLAARGVIGPSQWEPQASFTRQDAYRLGLEYTGPTGTEFIEAYRAAYGEEPSYFAAGGYAAGLALQNAIENAGGTDSPSVQAALDATDMVTFFGHTKFSLSQASHGLQTGHEMIYIQWQEDLDGGLTKRIIWPVELATSPLLYPLP